MDDEVAPAGHSSINNYGYAAGLALIMVIAIPVGFKKYYASQGNNINRSVVSQSQQKVTPKSAMEINRAAKSQAVENSGSDAAALRSQRVVVQQPMVRVPGLTTPMRQGAARTSSMPSSQPKAVQMPEVQSRDTSSVTLQPKSTNNTTMTKGSSSTYNFNTGRKGGR